MVEEQCLHYLLRWKKKGLHLWAVAAEDEKSLEAYLWQNCWKVKNYTWYEPTLTLGLWIKFEIEDDKCENFSYLVKSLHVAGVLTGVG